jgi:hypothetical protein
VSTFFHSGDIGDIIAALPTIRQMGGGDLRIGPEPQTGQREAMTKTRYEMLASLLHGQPYLRKVMFGVRKSWDIDLSHFRQKTRWNGAPESLADWQARAMGLTSVDLSPWLVAGGTHETAGRIILSRSARQHNPNFPWKRVLETYREKCIFIGLPGERHALEMETGFHIDHIETESFYHIASMIASAERGFYNSSAPFWVALGLGTNAVEEQSINEHVVFIPNRPNVTYVSTVEDGKKLFPEVPEQDARIVLLTAAGPGNERTRFAETTWEDTEYHHIKILHRDARDIGDERGTYYVKDVLDFSLMLSGDIFVYINNDVALVPEWKKIITPYVRAHGCAFSHRLDVPKFDRKLTLADINKTEQRAYCGADIIGFTPAWWEAHRAEFPDAVLGLEGWDAVMQWLMTKSGFHNMPTICYHQMHQSFWNQADNLTGHPAQKVVRQRLIEWAKAAGAEQYLYAPHGYLFKSGIFYDKYRPK